jgi:uncharacterized membrane protein YadS
VTWFDWYLVVALAASISAGWAGAVWAVEESENGTENDTEDLVLMIIMVILLAPIAGFLWPLTTTIWAVSRWAIKEKKRQK